MATIPARFSRQDLIRMGRTLQGKEMLRAQNLISGKTQPWELPEWQPVTEGLRTQHERGLEGLSSAYQQAGVTGPAAALGMERAGEGYEGSLMNLANKMRGMGHEEAWKGAGMGQAESQWLGKMVEARKGRKLQEDAARMEGISGGVQSGMSGLGSACGCRIFTEDWTKELEGSVRRFRDTHFSPKSYVSKGYKWMSNWVVPAMMKSKLIRKFVRLIMLKPIARVARWWEGKDKTGFVFIPIGIFWNITLDMFGRIDDLRYHTGV